MLEKLLADQCFSWSGGDVARIVTQTLQTKTIRGVVIAVREKNHLDIANMNFEMSRLALPGSVTR